MAEIFLSSVMSFFPEGLLKYVIAIFVDFENRWVYAAEG
jgi:hypothetical protein